MSIFSSLRCTSKKKKKKKTKKECNPKPPIVRVCTCRPRRTHRWSRIRLYEPKGSNAREIRIAQNVRWPAHEDVYVIISVRFYIAQQLRVRANGFLFFLIIIILEIRRLVCTFYRLLKQCNGGCTPNMDTKYDRDGIEIPTTTELYTRRLYIVRLYNARWINDLGGKMFYGRQNKKVVKVISSLLFLQK
jgi:hypothetical protein